MMGTGFVVAMTAHITTGGYDRPAQAGAGRDEWLIVSCWGADAEYLSISVTGSAVSDPSAAPDGLQPRSTYLGLLLSHGEEGTDSVYLLVRHLPDGVNVGGVFFPADGYARIRRCDTLRLLAAGRQAHSIGQCQGRETRADIPLPAQHDSAASSWHITGTCRPWLGTFVGDADMTPR